MPALRTRHHRPTCLIVAGCFLLTGCSPVPLTSAPDPVATSVAETLTAQPSADRSGASPPAPLPSPISTGGPETGVRGGSVKLAFGTCFDFDRGEIWEGVHQACDLSVNRPPNSPEGQIEFTPATDAALAYANTFSAPPLLSECVALDGYSEFRQSLQPGSSYICLRTNQGDYGYLKVAEINPQDIVIEWLTYDVSQATPQPGEVANAAQFISDVTVPDGMAFSPGEGFEKVWRLRNSGASIWGSDYSVVFLSGERMGAPDETQLGRPVPPGDTIDIGLTLQAPLAAGQYRGDWMLRSNQGQMFGVGPQGDLPFFVIIRVGGATAVPGTTTSGGSGLTVTAASLSVDRSTISGDCPVALVFSGTVTASGAGSLTYHLEAGSSTPGFSFSLPGPQQASYSSSGIHLLPVTYTLEIANSVSGWARLAASSTNSLRSNEVAFSVTCQ
jgi:hypothetical protein